MLSNKAEIVTKIITEKLLHSPHSEVSTYSKAFLRKKEGTEQVTFSNTPFSLAEEKVLDCQYGHHYFRKKKNQKVKDSVCKAAEKLAVRLPSKSKATRCTQNTQLVMSQGKVHAKSRYCKKISLSYYGRPLQKEMTSAQFQNILSAYHQRLHTQVTPLVVLEDLHKESIPSSQRKSLSWLLQG